MSKKSRLMGLTETSPLAIYRQHLREGKLAYQVDPVEKPVFFPRVIAPGSGSSELRWEISSGLGTVYATTTVRPRAEEPYNVCLVELDEGFRMMSSVRGIFPDSVSIGLRVQLQIDHSDAENPLALFVPAASEGASA